MKINISYLIDLLIEADDARSDYYKSSAKYYKKHGYGVNLDYAKSEDEKHIVYAYHSNDKANDIVFSIVQVLNINREQESRLYSACRAAKKWYIRTDWQRCLPSELIDRIEKYVMS